MGEEESARGELVAVDLDEDLAIVKASGVKQMPKPIDYRHEPKLAETMPVYSFGFPFGHFLATGKGNPAVTVDKATISSLRNDSADELALVQISGALNPGNSGGPVVDARGRLVGVAVATIKNSSGIGFAIPSLRGFPAAAGPPGQGCVCNGPRQGRPREHSRNCGADRPAQPNQVGRVRLSAGPIGCRQAQAGRSVGRPGRVPQVEADGWFYRAITDHWARKE